MNSYLLNAKVGGSNKEKGPMDHRLFVNDESTVLVRVWDDGTVEVAQRPAPGATWGPPTYLSEEVRV